MSYEQLMQHAAEIERLAVKGALEQKGFVYDPHGNPHAPTDIGEQGAQDIIDMTAKQFSDVQSMFSPFASMPDPNAFGGMRDDMLAAMRELSTGQTPTDPITGLGVEANITLDAMGGVGDALLDWHGKAAETFKLNFVEPFDSFTRNRFMLVAILKGGIEAEQEIWKNARANADKIAHDAITALEHMGDCGKNDWTMLFTVGASVAAVGATVVTGGTAIIALTAVGAASQVVAAAAPDDPPKTQFSGETAEAVISQVREALSTLASEIRKQEQKIASAMTSCSSYVVAHRSSFVAARPTLAGATASTVRDSQSGLGEA
jgi:hypothetical protein